MKKLFLFIFVIVMAGSAHLIGRADDEKCEKPQKIGYVHIIKIMPEEPNKGCLEWQERTKAFQTEMEKDYAKIQADMQRAQALSAEFESKDKSKWASDSSLESKSVELAQLDNNIKIAVQALRERQMKVMRDIQTDILMKIEKVGARIARELGYDIVFAQGAIYVSNSVDITDEVLHELDKQYKESKAAAKAAEKAQAMKPAAMPTKQPTTTPKAV